MDLRVGSLCDLALTAAECQAAVDYSGPAGAGNPRSALRGSECQRRAPGRRQFCAPPRPCIRLRISGGFSTIFEKRTTVTTSSVATLRP